MIAASRLRVTGVVQGVGFRPFVYGLARRLRLTGWVNNSTDGVTVVLEGEPEAVESFVRLLREEAPPVAVIETVELMPAEPEGFEDFEIRDSEHTEGAMTLVSPDIATCSACLREMRDQADRRFRYAFTNCTNCGPRFTVIEDVPYDRPSTTMRDFPMCPACEAEYRDPADRRFHAQPVACHTCGPRLFLNVKGRALSGWDWDASKETVPRRHRVPRKSLARDDDVVAMAVGMLQNHEIVAVKGLGGFQLACDATDEEAVARLRERKRRWGKPFAVMFPDLDTVRAYCDVSDEEAALLVGNVRPIVLLRLVDASGDGVAPLAASVAPGLTELGVMLPYTPLHHLLLGDFRGPLVMTSGNLSDEPIVTGNAAALDRLAPLADGFLMHDRPIRSRYDDSVARVVAGRTEIVRRARGYAPFPVRLPAPAREHVWAAGPEQKSTFCLARDGHAFVSQHIGDLENADVLESYEETLALYERLFRVEPAVVAYDLHPDYLATKLALASGLPAVGVQHHHAHIVAVAAENGVRERVIGLAFDGTGYGEDRTIWGGEVLLADWSSYERIAHLRPMRMPGGAAAIRRPARMALGLLYSLDRGLYDHPGSAGLRSRLATDELTTIEAMAEQGINSPLTSSMGRLFDAVAALTGVRDDAFYEGQPAIELEAAADGAERGSYRFDIVDGDPIVLDPLPAIEALLDDLAAGVPVPVLSARFHNGVAGAAVALARRIAAETGVRHVAMGGGVWMNRRLVKAVGAGLRDAGLLPLLPRDLPVNDGGVSYGQAVVACARRDAV